MDPVAPSRPPSPALKIATLLFSGSLAALAIANGGSLGCSPAETPDHPPAPDPTPQPQHSQQESRQESQATAEPAREAQAHANTPAPEVVDEPPKPTSTTNTNAPPTPRFIGGSKSDVDVFGVDGEGIGGLGLAGTRERNDDDDGAHYIGGSKSGLFHHRPAQPKPTAKPKPKPKPKPRPAANSNRPPPSSQANKPQGG